MIESLLLVNCYFLYHWPAWCGPMSCAVIMYSAQEYVFLLHAKDSVDSGFQREFWEKRELADHREQGMRWKHAKSLVYSKMSSKR